MYRMGNFFDLLSEHWYRATPTDFAVFALSAIVTVWFINKYYVT